MTQDQGAELVRRLKERGGNERGNATLVTDGLDQAAAAFLEALDARYHRLVEAARALLVCINEESTHPMRQKHSAERVRALAALIDEKGAE